jgi:hypothetical protein
MILSKKEVVQKFCESCDEVDDEATVVDEDCEYCPQPAKYYKNGVNVCEDCNED